MINFLLSLVCKTLVLPADDEQVILVPAPEPAFPEPGREGSLSDVDVNVGGDAVSSKAEGELIYDFGLSLLPAIRALSNALNSSKI